MKLKVLIAALIIAPLALTACSKKEQAADSGQQTTSETSQVEGSEHTSPEQQAAIDALDKPVMDEKNTDVPPEKANAPADVATPATEDEAEKATTAH